MTRTATTALPTANDVRAWGRDHGFEVSARGRLSHDLINAFNAKRKNKFAQTTAPEPVELTVEVQRVGKTGRKLRPAVETVTHGAIRVWAVEQGFDVPARGRVPQYLVDAYAVRNLAPAE